MPTSADIDVAMAELEAAQRIYMEKVAKLAQLARQVLAIGSDINAIAGNPRQTGVTI
jgi:hypothetical protein